MQRQLVQLDRLISDLIRTPGEAGAASLLLADVDIVQEAREAASRLRVVTPDARVRLTSSGEPPIVTQADPVRFAQVLDNILLNAVKFSPDEARIELDVHAGASEIALTIADHGEGIAADEIAHVFERYYRGSRSGRQVPGAGIGLAVARDIVQAHGGRIAATSDGPGRGSTFTIVLPLRHVEPARGSALSAPASDDRAPAAADRR